MSAGCPLHPGGGYGCPNCDRILQRRFEVKSELERLRAQRDELAEALRNLMDTGLDHTFCFSEDCGRCQECAARAALAKVKP